MKSSYEEAQKRGLVSQQSSGVADFFKSIPRGIVGGLAGAASAMGQAEAPLQGMSGVPGAEESTQLVEQNVTGQLPKPQGTAGKFGRTVGEFLGNPATYLGPGSLPAKALTGATAAIGSEAAGQATEGTSMELPARIAGGLVGAKAPSVAARTITPIPTPPSRQQYRRTLEAADIPYTAGQGTGNKALQWAEGHLGEMPGAGGAAERANTGSQEAFNRWALEQAGLPGAAKADQATIDRMWGDLYNRYGQITANNKMRLDQQWWQEFTDATQNYHDLVGANRSPAVQRITDQMTRFIAQRNFDIPGDVYQANRSQIERLARASKADPEASHALRDIARAMDDAFERGLAINNSPDLGQFRELRAQYRNATAIEKAIGVGAKSDDIPPGRLRQQLLIQDRRSYRRGTRDMAETTQAADKILAPLPQSGTAPRAAMQGISSGLGATMGAAMGGPAASVPAAIGGALAPGVAGRVLHSPPVQGYLGNELVNQQFPYAGTRALLPSAGSALEQEQGP
jgi:hypothetical protein